MAHVVLHEAALDAGASAGVVGATRRDDGDLWVVDGVGPEPFPVRRGAPTGDRGVFLSTKGVPIRMGGETVHALARVDGADAGITVVPRAFDPFDRVRGVFETDILRDRRVAIVGCGSGGSFIARELAKAGVGRFLLVDPDRLEPGNVCRHECGLSDVGRRKVTAVRDLILDRNPTADVHVLPLRLDGTTVEAIREAMADADLVIGATDNRESRLLLNRAAIRNGQPVLFGAVFRRAYGGQVLRVLPGITPCYQCFLQALPEMGDDREIATEASAAAIAYSDRPVAVEPGLSSDILPVALLMVKIAIVALLEGEPTTLAPLREDLVAPLYLWLNRRERGTDYAKLPPLEHRVDDMTILRWYGVLLPRDPSCAACGTYGEALLERLGLDADDLDTGFFGGATPIEETS